MSSSTQEMKQECKSCSNLNMEDILSSDILQQNLSSMPLWKINEKGQLSREFIAKNFQIAIEFINLVAKIAEDNGHHPDIHITSYRNVEIILFTHSVGGITEADVQLAKLLDTLPVQYSPKWARENIPQISSEK